jgi:glycine cleavage system aminomethyltransferase T
LIPARASLFDASGKAVGDVRSSVVSPRLGAIALGMVRLEIENGAPLTARWSADAAGDAPAGESAVEIVPLPFATQ